jgi:tetratricopeptide (TPR) repeat protein
VIETEAEKEFSRGLKALQEDNSLAALVCFEKANTLGERPVYFSYLGFCVAKERGQIQKGMLLCSAAMEREPENSVHYLNLGRIYLVAGNKQEAIRVLRKGLAYGPNQEIIGLLDSIGTRKHPIIRSLSRDNLINKYLGKLLSRLGFR